VRQRHRCTHPNLAYFFSRIFKLLSKQSLLKQTLSDASLFLVRFASFICLRFIRFTTAYFLQFAERLNFYQPQAQFIRCY
jgi:hypothetical protein